jgi:hypothetical protein
MGEPQWVKDLNSGPGLSNCVDRNWLWRASPARRHRPAKYVLTIQVMKSDGSPALQGRRSNHPSCPTWQGFVEQFQSEKSGMFRGLTGTIFGVAGRGFYRQFEVRTAQIFHAASDQYRNDSADDDFYHTESLTPIYPVGISWASAMRALKEHTPELGLDASATGKLDAQVHAIETQVASPNPNRTVLEESLRTIRNVLEGCVGSLIASGLLFEVGKLLNS